MAGLFAFHKPLATSKDPMYESIEEPIRLQCRHIHTDGRRCGSPSVRTQNFCYYHGKTRRPGPRQPQVKTLADRKGSTFDLPTPADLAERPGIQLALANILHKIAHNEIDPRRAGLLLYGLQIASMNLKHETELSKKANRRDLVEPVEELIEDDLHGPLAPEAEYEEYQGPKSTVERLIEEFEEAGRREEEERQARLQAEEQAGQAQQQAQDQTTSQPEPQPTFTLHATAQPCRKSRPNSLLWKTLRKKYGVATARPGRPRHTTETPSPTPAPGWAPRPEQASPGTAVSPPPQSR